jgi:hypothetical protein
MTLEPAREARFPNLNRTEYRVTSAETEDYNCIAWAAGDSSQWWWPNPDDYWPDTAPREETLDSFRAVFEAMGYQECATADFEVDFEKIAIFVDSDGVPTHAARQLDDGAWTSKLGDWEDIKHDSLNALENAPFMNSLYGTVSLFMRRRRNQNSS